MKKFFVIGCPRSGTTMIQQALNRHSQIAIPPETKFFFSFDGHSHRAQEKHLDRLNGDLNIRLRLPAAGVRSDSATRAFYEEMAAAYVATLRKPDVSLFGEKTPEHTGHLGRIRKLFPDAKIIAVYRDGRDVALSLSKTPWASKSIYANFIIWLYYQRIISQATAGTPDLYLVRYEDVVTRPEEEFRSLLEYLDLPYEAGVAKGCGNNAGIPKREYAWKANALQKISPDRVGAFQDELSPAQVAVMERLGRQTLTAFGYPLLTAGEQPLPVRSLLKLATDLTSFMTRVPWYSVVRELTTRVRSELAGMVASPVPAVEQGVALS